MAFFVDEVVPGQGSGQELDGLLGFGEPLFAQAPLVERVAADEVVLEGSGGPDAELRAALGVDAVADGDDYVQAVKGTGLSDFAMCIFCTLLSSLSSPFEKNVANVLGDDGPFTPKQINHLGLRQPHRLPGKPDIQGGLAVLGPVQDHRASVVRLCFCHGMASSATFARGSAVAKHSMIRAAVAPSVSLYDVRFVLKISR